MSDSRKDLAKPLSESGGNPRLIDDPRSTLYWLSKTRPSSTKLASPLSGKNGAQIWGVDYKGKLYTNYQITPGGGWDGG